MELSNQFLFLIFPRWLVKSPGMIELEDPPYSPDLAS